MQKFLHYGAGSPLEVKIKNILAILGSLKIKEHVAFFKEQLPSPEVSCDYLAYPPLSPPMISDHYHLFTCVNDSNVFSGKGPLLF